MVSRCAAQGQLILCSQAQMTCRDGINVQGAQQVELACRPVIDAVSVPLGRAAVQKEPGLIARPAESPHCEQLRDLCLRHASTGVADWPSHFEDSQPQNSMPLG